MVNVALLEPPLAAAIVAVGTLFFLVLGMLHTFSTRKIKTRYQRWGADHPRMAIWGASSISVLRRWGVLQLMLGVVGLVGVTSVNPVGFWKATRDGLAAESSVSRAIRYGAVT